MLLWALLMISALQIITPFHPLTAYRGRSLGACDMPPLQASTSPFDSTSEWYTLGECQVLLPEDRIPKSIIHFTGGFLAGSAVQASYSSLLSALSANGHLVVATPLPPVGLDHGKISEDLWKAFADCYSTSIVDIVGPGLEDVPVIGLSHSLGGKLMALMNSNKMLRRKPPFRAANVYLAFNNFDLQESLSLSKEQAGKVSPQLQSILDTVLQSLPPTETISDALKYAKEAPILDTLISRGSSLVDSVFGDNKEVINRMGDNLDVSGMIRGALEDPLKKVQSAIGDLENLNSNFEFKPTPEDTWECILEGYNVQRNVLIQFDDDDIDQSLELGLRLRKRGCSVDIRSIPGNHLTPNLPFAVNQPLDTNTPGLYKPTYGFDDYLVKTFNYLANLGALEGKKNDLMDPDAWIDNGSMFYLPPAGGSDADDSGSAADASDRNIGEDDSEIGISGL